MKKIHQPIYLNDILQIDDISNTKIRFNLMFEGNWDPIYFYKSADTSTMLSGQYWNYNKKKSFQEGQSTLGFLRINNNDQWLLFHAGKVIKDLNIYNGVGYEFEDIKKYEKFIGRIIIRFKNKSQTLIRRADSVIDECIVEQILPTTYENDSFPGYENINLSWKELKIIINNSEWKAALGNQKGVYLITDSSNGRMYVGAAYGQDMIWGRWASYVKTFHGGNEQLKKLCINDIKNNFRYSILEIFKATTNDEQIIKREQWWKSILKTRDYGYNSN